MPEHPSLLGADACLALEDGRCFYGRRFGADLEVDGEVVFNTSMTGYQEIATDPSYHGQMVVLTHPQIGNYGVQHQASESIQPWITALIIRDLTVVPNHWRSFGRLEDFLRAAGVPGIEGVDTRALTRHLRTQGTMRGALGRLVDGRVEACSEALVERAKLAPTLSAKALVDDVSSPTGVSSPTDRSARQRSPRQFRRRIALIDCGAKHNIVRSLTAYGAEVVPLSWRASFDEVAAARADGVVVSNGPGDPEMAGPAVGLVRSLLEEGVPILGICLGHQVLGMAAGATTSRLRFGHHGGNHPVRDLTTGRIHITSQNHEFQVDAGSVPASSGFVVSMVNLNDGSVEGLAHRVLPVFSVQYHPEGCPGPQDNQYVFERFLEMVERPISGSSALARDIT